MRMKNKTFPIIIAATVLLVTTVIAQDANNTPAVTPTTTTVTVTPTLSPGSAQVLRLSQAKLGEEAIAKYISVTPGNYSLNAAQIIYLKQQGVSDNIVIAMLEVPKPEYLPAKVYNPPSAPIVAYTPPQQQTVTYVQPAPAVTYVQPAPVYYSGPSDNAVMVGAGMNALALGLGLAFGDHHDGWYNHGYYGGYHGYRGYPYRGYGGYPGGWQHH